MANAASDSLFRQADQLLAQNPPDYGQALPLLQQAARQGHAEAAFQLAGIFLEQSEPDIEAAIPWLEIAAKQNHPYAVYNLLHLRERAGELQGRLGDAWRAGAGRGGWEGVFGDFAEETFTAWHMARYIESVAAAGKAEYPLPLVVNCWLDKGREAGAFPTGGPVARVMEVWRCAAPSIDVVAPDIYVPDFCGTCDGYRGLGNPLVIEETAVHGRVASRAVWAVCHHHAPCFAPFGFEDMGEPFDDAAGVLFGASLDPAAVVPQDAKEYARVMAALGELVARARDVRGGLEGMDAVISERPETDVLAVGSDGIAGINVSYDDHPGACAVVPLGPDEALVLALHCRVTPVSLDPGCPHADILSLDELVSDEGGAWSCGRRLNGDEATLLRFDGPTLLRLRLFSYR